MPAIAFDRFVREYLSVRAASRRKGTVGKDRQALRELGALGLRSTRDLTPEAIGRFIAASRATGRSDVTTDGLVRAIAAACTYAVKLGHLRVSPFEVVDCWGLDTEPAEEVVRYLTLPQLGRLLGTLERGATDWRGRRLYALVATVAYTGIRRSEALHLRREDVDLRRGFLRIPKRRLSHRAKTRASAALVPIPSPLRAVLIDWRRRNRSPWLFPGVTGRGPWTGGSPGFKPLDELKAAAREAGLGRVTFLMLRHSFATHAPRWGIDAIRLKQILRHTTIRTQRHYVHPDEEGLRDAVRRVRFDPPAPRA